MAKDQHYLNNKMKDMMLRHIHLQARRRSEITGSVVKERGHVRMLQNSIAQSYVNVRMHTSDLLAHILGSKHAIVPMQRAKPTLVFVLETMYV